MDNFNVDAQVDVIIASWKSYPCLLDAGLRSLGVRTDVVVVVELSGAGEDDPALKR